MKRAMCVLLAVLCFSAISWSQVELGAGPKLGLALSNVWGDDTFEDSETKLGLIAGGMFHVRFAEFIGAQAEILYSMKGSEFEENLTLANISTSSTRGYLEFPMLAKLAVDLDLPVTPVAFVGPTFGFLLNVKDRITTTTTFGAQDERESTDKDDYAGFEFGMAFGAGVEIAAGPGAILVDFRYTLGLTDVFDDNIDADVKNGQFGISGGYLFGF